MKDLCGLMRGVCVFWRDIWEPIYLDRTANYCLSAHTIVV